MNQISFGALREERGGMTERERERKQTREKGGGGNQEKHYTKPCFEFLATNRVGQPSDLWLPNPVIFGFLKFWLADPMRANYIVSTIRVRVFSFSNLKNLRKEKRIVLFEIDHFFFLMVHQTEPLPC